LPHASANWAGEGEDVLTKGDEYPIHQRPEPIAFSGSDRNFYDRFFFNLHRHDGSGFVALAFGVYPHLNVADAHASALRDGVQYCLHASRILDMERMDLKVGPIAIEVIEPLKSLRVLIEGAGWKADLVCEGRSFPVQEPRFTRRNGPRMIMDATRFTQAVRWSGWLEIDGVREAYEPQSTVGVRDRSWGVRPIGAADPQPAAPPSLPQYYWLWAPTNFPNLALYFHVNEDAQGAAWNTSCVLAPDGAAKGGLLHLVAPRAKLAWETGARRAREMALEVNDPSGQQHRVVWTPIDIFQMKGIGYLHPEWAHGLYKGTLAVERESFAPSQLDALALPNVHVQAICKARHEGAGLSSEGVGVFEQLIIGPHAPSGFKEILDGAS
jgi:hypothetical protein